MYTEFTMASDALTVSVPACQVKDSYVTYQIHITKGEVRCCGGASVQAIQDTTTLSLPYILAADFLVRAEALCGFRKAAHGYQTVRIPRTIMDPAG